MEDSCMTRAFISKVKIRVITSELSELISEVCITVKKKPIIGKYAARILHLIGSKSFSELRRLLRKDPYVV